MNENDRTIPAEELLDNAYTENSFQEVASEINGDVNDITYEDMIFNSIGFDEFDNPKSGIALEIGTFDGNTAMSQLKTTLSYYNPSIEITRTGEAMMIDLVFEKRTDADLRAIWGLFNKYGKDFENAIKENSAIIPLIRLQIVPTVYCGRLSIICVSPMYWALQPSTPTSEINTIRLVYATDSVGFLASEGYDEKQILAEIEREEMQRDFLEESIEREREEREEYMAERNAMLEEMRRNKME